MSPRRTSPQGSFRFNRDFTRLGVGVVQCSSRTDILREFRRRDAILTKLAEACQVETLRALKEGRISIEQLVEADRRNRLSGPHLLSDLTLQHPLWTAIEATLPQLGRSRATRKRYQCSFETLRRKAHQQLGEHAVLADLEHVSWTDLYARWGASAADWNHLRRAVSTLLSHVLDDKYHPFRRQVLKRFPKATEVARVPDLSTDLFWKIIEKVPEHARGLRDAGRDRSPRR